MNLTDVDGIPAFWMDTPGPARSGLVFRIGLGDEVLHRRGTTRLLQRQASADGGRTDLLSTGFEAAGSPTEIAEALNTVALALTHGDDIEAAAFAETLRNEPPPLARTLLGRIGNEIFGARGPGLLALPELGLERPDPVWLGSWRRTYFTRGNAALWSVGPPAPLLDLTALLPGERSAVTGLTRRWTGGRRRVTHPVGGICLAALAPQGPALEVVAAALRQRLERALVDEGPATAVHCEIDAVDALDALVVFFAACEPSHSDELTERFLLELSRVRARGFGDEPLPGPRLRGDAEVVRAAAERALLGLPLVQPADEIRRAEAAGPQEVTALAVSLLTDGFLVVPHTVGGDRRYRIAPDPNAWTIPDVHAAYSSVDPSDPDARLLMAPTGITVARAERRSSFRFADIDAMARFSDEGRVLWNADGRTFVLDHRKWRGAANLPFEIDERIERSRQTTFDRPLATSTPMAKP